MRYRVLGQHTGLRVSELVLGAGLFGTRWGYGTEPDEARRIFDKYVEAGGNFIDTADSYQFGESESLLGDFTQLIRDDLVIGTKYTQSTDPKGSLSVTGNSRKSLIRSVEQSLKRLGTDRIDILYAHLPDFVTPIEEIVRGMDDLVRAGKVIYAGLSDFPAWRTASAATLAQARGWAPIVAQQIEYSLVQRSADRDLLPMAAAHGLATLAWSPLGGGVLSGKYRRGETGRQTQFGGRLFHAEDTAQKTEILDTLEAVAQESGANTARVAIAWILAKGIFPIIGPKSVSQLEDNLASIDVKLTIEQIERLDQASAISLGFPHDFIGAPVTRDRVAGGKHGLIEFPAQPVR